MLEGLSGRRQLRGPRAQHDQHLLGPNLIGVVRHPTQSSAPATGSRKAATPTRTHVRIVAQLGRAVVRQPAPTPPSKPRSVGRKPTIHEIYRGADHAATKPVPLQRWILRQAAFHLGPLLVLLFMALRLLFQPDCPLSLNLRILLSDRLLGVPELLCQVPTLLGFRLPAAPKKPGTTRDGDLNFALTSVHDRYTRRAPSQWKSFPKLHRGSATDFEEPSKPNLPRLLAFHQPTLPLHLESITASGTPS